MKEEIDKLISITTIEEAHTVIKLLQKQIQEYKDKYDDYPDYKDLLYKYDSCTTELQIANDKLCDIKEIISRYFKKGILINTLTEQKDWFMFLEIEEIIDGKIE